MNAVNPAPSTSSAGSDQRPYEPSMEEILASIRRIIADDQSLPARGPARDLSGFGGDKRDTTPDEPIPTLQRTAPTTLLKPEPPISPQGYVAAPQFPTPDVPVITTFPLKSAVKPEMVDEPPPVAAQAPSPAHEPDPFAADPVRDETPPRPSVTHDSEPYMAEPRAPDAGVVEASRKPSPVEQIPIEEAPVMQSHIDRHDAGQTTAHASEPEPDPYFDPPVEHDEPSPAAEMPAGLFSSHTKQSVSTAFNVLAATRLADNSEELLGLARDMIRPLLKTWLDDNLPSMVERMVRAEIERVARGGR